jgi:uncharacterized membrane protein YkoI
MKTTKLLTPVLAGFLFVAATTVAQDQGNSAKKKQALPPKSSIQVPEDKDRPKPTTEKEKQAEEKRLLSLAKITPDEAKAVGMAAYDGIFKYVKIHNYGGNLAYEVEFKDGLELIIDAGNKAILQIRIEKGSAMDKARSEAGK